jgi:hypothetical protein
MSDFITSEEQQTAIDFILAGENVVLDAVAGSGKSTTVLSLARQVPLTTKILQLAYNAILRKEVQAKLKEREIKNVTVHTFHSLAVKYYLLSAHTDTGLRKIVREDMRPKIPIPKYQIIVLDESQDMSFLYFQFMVKFAFDMGERFQLCILGDYMQGIYEFKGADIRSLTHAHIIWKNHPLLSSRVFRQCTLQTSYRITNQHARFNNDVLLGMPRLKAVKNGPPVEYIRNNRTNLEKTVIAKIQQWIRTGVSPGDIFVLAASVKGLNSNVRKMENALVERGIPCYVPIFDTEGIEDKVIEGKVVFSTFHSVKGRERPYVLIMGFDQSYFDMYGQDFSTDKCPNVFYVACTRSTNKLILLEKDDHFYDRPFDFLKKTHREMRDEGYVEFSGVPREKFYEKPPITDETIQNEKERFFDVVPSELAKYVQDHVLENIAPLIETIFIQEVEPTEESTIEIPNIIQTSRGLYEDVCDLNGIALPSIYCDHLFREWAIPERRHNGSEGEHAVNPNIGASILRHIIVESLADTTENQYLYLKRLVDKMPEVCETPADYLRLSNLYVACKERLLFKWNQIGEKDYGWLDDDTVSKFMERLDSVIGAECANHPPPLVEHSIIDREMEAETATINTILQQNALILPRKVRFSARADMITWRTLWELKCTGSLTVEHKLQTILYAWLWYIVNTSNMGKSRETPECPNPRETRLFNIKTGEILRLNATFEDLTIIVVELLRGKYESHLPKTNEEFLEDCEKFMASYLNKNLLSDMESVYSSNAD